MYARGMGHRSIARTLNEERVPSPLQGTNSPIKRMWNAAAIRDILKRDRYRGVHVWNKTKMVRNPTTKRKEQVARPESEWERVDVPEWRIVSDELWDAVQAENARRQDCWKKGYGGLNLTKTSRRYLFGGLMTCGVCGSNFNIVEGKGEFARYGCIGQKFRGTCPSKLTILRRVLEPRLTAALAKNLQDPALLAQGACRGHKGVDTWYASAATPTQSSATSSGATSSASSVPTPKAAEPSSSNSSAKTSASAKTPAPGGGPGLVWVNTASNVYHCYGTRYYGTTKAGKYMSEADAKAAGARPDHGKACSQ
jgi:hypothetical protein